MSTFAEIPANVAITFVAPSVVLEMSPRAWPALEDVENEGLSVAKLPDCVKPTVAPGIGVPRSVTVAVSASPAPFAAGVSVCASSVIAVCMEERSGET